MIQTLYVFYNAFASERDQKCTCPRLHSDYYFLILNVELKMPELKKSFTKILRYHLNWAEIINLYNNNTFQNNKRKISLRWLGQPISTFHDLFSNWECPAVIKNELWWSFNFNALGIFFFFLRLQNHFFESPQDNW